MSHSPASHPSTIHSRSASFPTPAASPSPGAADNGAGQAQARSQEIAAIGAEFARAFVDDGLEGVAEALKAAKRAAGLLSLYDPASAPQFQFFPANEIKLLPKYEFYYDGLIQARGINVVYGAPKVGKSFITLLIASTVAQQMAVLYAAAEGLPGYSPRIAALETAYKRPVGSLTFTRAVNLFEDETVFAFIEAARTGGYRLIIFDTLAACMIGADENSNQDMQRVISNCQRIVDALDCAVLLVHHATKQGGQYRGASALFGGVDVMMELTNDDGVIALTYAGAKNREAFDPHFYRLVQHGESVAAMRTERHLTDGTKLTPLQVKILETLRLGTFVIAGAKSAQLITILAVSPASVYRALGALIDKTYVRQAAKGDPYYIEDAGIKALSLLSDHSRESAESGTSSLNSTLSHSHTPLGVRVERVDRESPASKSESSSLPEQEGDNLPNFAALIEPLHGSNGRRG